MKKRIISSLVSLLVCFTLLACLDISSALAKGRFVRHPDDRTCDKLIAASVKTETSSFSSANPLKVREYMNGQVSVKTEIDTRQLNSEGKWATYKAYLTIIIPVSREIKTQNNYAFVVTGTEP